jgi:hypothetical protein
LEIIFAFICTTPTHDFQWALLPQRMDSAQHNSGAMSQPLSEHLPSRYGDNVCVQVREICD